MVKRRISSSSHRTRIPPIWRPLSPSRRVIISAAVDFRVLMRRLHRLIIIGTLILTACGAEAAPPAIVTTEIISTETPPPLLQAPTVVPTMTFTPSNQPLTLGVWWPESFAPPNNNEALAVLSGQINTFQ